MLRDQEATGSCSGNSVKAAIAAAGGEGSAVEKPLTVAAMDFISAEERVRQLEADHVSLLVRKARLEAQRDDRGGGEARREGGRGASKGKATRIWEWW